MSSPIAGAARVRHGQTAAQGVIAALGLPAAPSLPPSRPLPLTGLHRLPRDNSMLYDIGQVDESGRVASEIVAALRWQPHDRLEVILTEGAIVLRASPDGLFSASQRPRIIIPSAARRRHAIQPGDHVLIAAAPDAGVVIAYPLSALDDMISCYHLAHSATEHHEHE
jgi:bifunctional DNA-binding transcriptional regulator/antitoxin component of YhaV-PrlF toxin-antitoxin module